MSIFKEFNDMCENGPIKFEKKILEIANKIGETNKKDILYKDIPFIPSKVEREGLTIYYGARVINKEISIGKKEVKIDFLIGYVLDKHGILIMDTKSVEEANNLLREYLDLKTQKLLS